MPLVVSVNGRELNVGADLAHILGSDNGNLGNNPLPGGTQEQVSYAQAQHDFVKDRMNAVINNTPSNTILVTGVDSTFVLPDGTPITSAAGVASVPPGGFNSAGTGVLPGITIDVIYDTGACNGSGYCVFDTGGNSIADPTEVILFHELAHAFHEVNNDFDPVNPEPQAENDENQLRTQEGLPERDANNHSGGCGSCTGGKSCLIVTAAAGSDRTHAVRALQQVRDHELRSSRIADAFFACLLLDYYQFSPTVARDMDHSLPLRAALTALLVDPFLGYIGLFERYVRGGWQDPAFGGEAGRVLSQRGHRPEVAALRPSVVCDGLDRLGGSAPGSVVKPPQRRFRPDDPASALDYLAAVVRVDGSSGACVRWGLLEPLRVWWSAMARIEAGQAPEEAGGWLISRMLDWLVTPPIPPGIEFADAAALAAELHLLARALFVLPETRTRVGSRLLAAIRPIGPYDVAQVFADCGYLAPAI
jgi:hypothetical protein